MITKVSFFEHDLGEKELEAIRQVFAGPILTTGEWVSEFERRFADYLGGGHALGVTSCTGAMHMSLLALDIGPGDEVITTPLTFIATSCAIMEAGARPVFVDVEPSTGNIDAAKIEAAITPRTKAILPVHLYGQMCDMREIRRIADRHRLYVIEDAAHCVEGERDGVKPGQLSDTACFSFFATKNMTCGEGGAIFTKRSELVEKLKLLRLHGMTKTSADRFREGYQHWDMVHLGWKYNMDNIQAAMLLPQLERLPDSLRKRDSLWEQYCDNLRGIGEIQMPRLMPQTRHARHLFVIWVAAEWRDRIISLLQAEGVPAFVNYRAIHLLSFFSSALGYKRGDFPNAEQIGDCTLSLPFHTRMRDGEIQFVAGKLRTCLRMLQAE